MTSGIYKITNLVNNKFYIGSSINLEFRCAKHLSNLRLNKHENSHLQRAWNKYKESSFRFETLEIVEDISILLSREQYYLDSLSPQYNICKIAGSCLGRKTKESTKEKLRNINLGKKHSPATKLKLSIKFSGRVITPEHKLALQIAHKRFNKPVEAIDPITGIVQKFDSIKSAARALNAMPSSIRKACYGKLKTHKNLYWRFHSTGVIK